MTAFPAAVGSKSLPGMRPRRNGGRRITQETAKTDNPLLSSVHASYPASHAPLKLQAQQNRAYT